MIDELHELRKANPHEPADLAGSVAMSRDDLIVALRTDSSRFPFTTNLVAQQRRRQAAIPARVSWASALAAIVLAVVVFGQMVVGGDEAEVDVAEIPTTLPIETPTTTLVVEAVADDASTTTVEESAAARTTSTAPASSTPTTLGTAPPVAPSTTQAAPSTTAAPTTAPSTTAPPTTAPTTAPSQPAIDRPFTRGDLLAVHLDFGHTDDGLAALASREVTEWFGLNPIVVAGTDQPDAFAHSYTGLMNSGWGSDWVDAAANRTAAVDLATAEWLGVLDAGGDVWVAEGGVSDFSAEVLRSIRTARPGLDAASRIHVVQHAQRNEDETTPADFTYVQANADYIRIDDGNSANDTADLKMPDNGFTAAALAGPRSAAWAEGFDFHSSDIDFSDTVTVLHILGISTDQVADPDDFAAMFM